MVRVQSVWYVAAISVPTVLLGEMFVTSVTPIFPMILAENQDSHKSSEAFKDCSDPTDRLDVSCPLSLKRDHMTSKGCSFLYGMFEIILFDTIEIATHNKWQNVSADIISPLRVICPLHVTNYQVVKNFFIKLEVIVILLKFKMMSVQSYQKTGILGSSTIVVKNQPVHLFSMNHQLSRYEKFCVSWINKALIRLR